MNIPIDKTLRQIARCLDVGQVNIEQLRKAYDLTFKLQSQLLGVIYDMETFTLDSVGPRIAVDHSRGHNDGEAVTLTINEALPPMKRLTEAIQEHWKAMIHEAIDEAARQKPLPYFEKAMVEITVITPRGTNNANVWDTSNRAINVAINNLKGIFFRDDNIEHMAFSIIHLKSPPVWFVQIWSVIKSKTQVFRNCTNSLKPF